MLEQKQNDNGLAVMQRHLLMMSASNSTDVATDVETSHNDQARPYISCTRTIISLHQQQELLFHSESHN